MAESLPKASISTAAGRARGQPLLFRPHKIRHYLTMMQTSGFTAGRVLSGSGITPAQLEDSSLLVNLEQCETVIVNILQLTGDPAIGLRLGNSTRITDFGIVTFAMMSSQTLGQAAQLWVRFSNLVGMTTLRVVDHQDRWDIVIEPWGHSPDVLRLSVEEYLTICSRLGAELAGCPMQISRCEIAYPAPAHQALYRQLLGCDAQFGGRENRITIGAPLLNMPLRGRDPELHAICRRRCAQLMRIVAGQGNVISRLRSLLFVAVGDMPSLQQAADHLGVSARSLRRHLHEQGTSYQKLVDEVRLTRAKQYLAIERLSVKEVGYLLGFHNSNAFRKAFKAWTGHPVGAFLASGAPVPRRARPQADRLAGVIGAVR